MDADKLRQCVVAALMLQRLLPFASALDPAQGRAAEETVADLVEWLRGLGGYAQTGPSAGGGE